MKISHKNNKKGFTLVEILVSLMIFTFVMTIGLATLMVTNASSKRAIAIKTAIDNIQYSMEVFTRTARLGSNYTCLNPNPTYISIATSSGANCSSGGGVAFFLTDPTVVPNQTDAYAYYLDNTSNPGKGQLFRCVARNIFPGGIIPPTPYLMTLSGNCAPLTSEDIEIKTFDIVVSGATPSDNEQPGIAVKISGDVNTSEGGTTFGLQTFISQRQYE